MKWLDIGDHMLTVPQVYSNCTQCIEVCTLTGGEDDQEADESEEEEDEDPVSSLLQTDIV